MEKAFSRFVSYFLSGLHKYILRPLFARSSYSCVKDALYIFMSKNDSKVSPLGALSPTGPQKIEAQTG
jgi:hypothetical protein